jgi:hypothetical protein
VLSSRMTVLTCFILVSSPSTADTPSWMEGTWAQTPRDCRSEGFTTRTTIALKDARLGPLYDQYEHHCRIIATRPLGAGVILRLSCHEFWDDFRSRKNDRSEQVTVRPRPDRWAAQERTPLMPSMGQQRWSPQRSEARPCLGHRIRLGFQRAAYRCAGPQACGIGLGCRARLAFSLEIPPGPVGCTDV